MSLQVEKLEKSMAKLTIEVPAEEFEKACEKVYQKQKSRIQIPGFRKGKAPRKMIENMYGKEVFYEDAANELIPEAYEKAYDECGEEITSVPEIDVIQLEAGKPFIFTALVALKPEVKLGKYKGVSVEETEVVVTEEDITAEIDKQRKSNARTVTVEDRAVKNGDITALDFEGFCDGVPFDGGKGENFPLTIGSGQFIPGFEEQLIGAELNKEVEINVTFPEDYQAENLAGKPAVFKCTVKEIKEEVLPELDDEFASEVSEFDTLEEYKADVKKNLEEKKAREARELKSSAALTAVVAASEIDIPAPMLATEQRQMADQYMQRLQAQGISMDMYTKYTGVTREGMIEQYKAQAEEKIKSRLCMEAVAEAEKMEVTEEDFEQECSAMATVYQLEIEKVKEMLGEEGKKNVMKDILVQKALDFVTDNAKAKKAAAKKTAAKKTTKKADDAEEVTEAKAEDAE